ncbi:glycosyltransferase [Tessaracoccus caeni]|uniref:glycosyltransferase n=1 Tax=Tessaracoccus caeni TaxID=3031239 RepID=UPI0023DB57CB|nr:glycosyltransferase [Tessaracoccus caeni]MDF1489388.1 glycosyltransferase [Tessaracoccus caeni]
MAPRVSVVLPFHNVAAYLEQCLHSILSQTLTDFELICVDDGSTDGSAEIARAVCEGDARATIIRQENQGAGVARNVGLRVATGEYLSFLDSDDFFEPSMLERAVHLADQTQADVVCFRSDRFVEATGVFERADWALKTTRLPKKKVFAPIEIRPNVFRSAIGWAWDKLFRADFVREAGLTFQEIRVHNDMVFTYTALLAANRISVLDSVLAHHRLRNSGSLSNADTKIAHLDCIRDSLAMLRDELATRGLLPTYGRDLTNYALSLFLYHLDSLEGPGRWALLGLLRDHWFREFGFDLMPRDYFYDRSEYERYLVIRDSAFEELLAGVGASETERLAVRVDYARYQARLAAEHHDRQLSELREQLGALTLRLEMLGALVGRLVEQAECRNGGLPDVAVREMPVDATPQRA